jgi:hypothetical protein
MDKKIKLDPKKKVVFDGKGFKVLIQDQDAWDRVEKLRNEIVRDIESEHGVPGPIIKKDKAASQPNE